MDFSLLRQLIAGTPLQVLAPFLEPAFLDGLRHGDHYRWRRLLAQFPVISPSSVNFDDVVRIGQREDSDEETRLALEAMLREFIPWRKGPFELFGIHIDSEWRSELKWARLAAQLGPLSGHKVLDVGSGNGYSSFRMLGAGAELVIGLEPHIPYYGQFWAIKHFLPQAPVFVLPLTLEQFPEALADFDTVFSMGVLYHRRSPLDHLLQLFGCLKPGGQLLMETIYVEGEAGYSLMPDDRYARMNNVWFLPSIPTLLHWLGRCGFINARVIDKSVTDTEEQRQTDWMPYDSFDLSLAADDQNKTIEGYPAPKRVMILCDKP